MCVTLCLLVLRRSLLAISVLKCAVKSVVVGSCPVQVRTLVSPAEWLLNLTKVGPCHNYGLFSTVVCHANPSAPVKLDVLVGRCSETMVGIYSRRLLPLVLLMDLLVVAIAVVVCIIGLVVRLVLGVKVASAAIVSRYSALLGHVSWLSASVEISVMIVIARVSLSFAAVSLSLSSAISMLSVEWISLCNWLVVLVSFSSFVVVVVAVVPVAAVAFALVVLVFSFLAFAYAGS